MPPTTRPPRRSPSRRVLVTGGAGFLGGHLGARLRAGGDEVVVLDDLSAPSPWPGPGVGSVHVADVRDPRAVARAAEGADLVVHLASVVGVDAVVAAPARTRSVIEQGTRVVADVAAARGVPLVFVSSSEVADPPRSGPRAAYARAKAWAEAFLRARRDRLDVTIVRPFNVVGPGQVDGRGMVLPALARAALDGRPLRVHGDGRQTRTFLHVADFVDAFVALLEAGPGPSGAIVEIGGERATAIADVARRLVVLAGGRAPVEHVAMPRGREDTPRRRPDLTALRSRLPFEPRRDLQTILADVLAFVA